MRPEHLKIEYKTEMIDVALHDIFHPDQEPVPVETAVLYVSWETVSDETDYKETFQTAYRIAVYRNGECLYEGGKVDSTENFCRIPSPPERLKDDDFLFLSVTLWDQDQQLTETVTIDL